MSFRAKRELLVQVAPRYRAARHGQRSVILDEFVAVTGYERKYAIRLLLGPTQSARHGPAAGAVTQPSDGGSIAKAVPPATRIDDHQTRSVAQAAHPGAHIHRVD